MSENKTENKNKTFSEHGVYYKLFERERALKSWTKEASLLSLVYRAEPKIIAGKIKRHETKDNKILYKDETVTVWSSQSQLHCSSQ